MTVAASARANDNGTSAGRLYERIGQFLVDQRLEPSPMNFTFAHAVIANPRGPLAQTVARLTDGGVRLTLKDIETLGCQVSAAANPAAEAASVAQARADGLVAKTQMQVEGFEDVVEGLRAETEGFGRDLAASADALRRSQTVGPSANAAIDEVARITAAMVERVHATEAQLEQVTREAAELRVLLDDARDNARRDPLTDLPNRRAFEEVFAAKALAGETLWLAVCDVDHFKSVNDRFGHAVGDRVLKAIAESLAETCSDHMVARYGGEEFVVLFSGIDAGTARATLEIAREMIAAKRYTLRETDAKLGSITISAGLAPSAQDDNPRSVFGRADALLYEAKRNGRNCVRVG